MLEGIAVVLGVIIELVGIREEVRTRAESIGTADVRARQAYLLGLFDEENRLIAAVEGFAYFVTDIGIGVLIRDDLHGILDASGTMVGSEHQCKA